MAVILAAPSISNAKTIKKIPNGGYVVEYTTAKIQGGKLIVKGMAQNWARATETPEYEKTGNFKFKLTKKCEIQDEKGNAISVKKFNKLCKKHDETYAAIAFMVKSNKVSLVRFW